jgi:protein-disulfide isomerase
MIHRVWFLSLFLGASVAGALAQTAPPSTPSVPAPVAPVEAPKPTLENASTLGDITLGDPKAPITIIEYASLTCGHCARFHADVLPTLKEKYIKTGKVRYILREFPLDAFATAGFMLARCRTNDQYYPVVDLLFEKQRDWTTAAKPLDALNALAKLLDGVRATAKTASTHFGVNSTPTFFINGKIQPGALRLDEMEALFKPLLP